MNILDAEFFAMIVQPPPVISIKDEAMDEKAESLIGQRKPFIIQANPNFKHQSALLRWLHVYQGNADQRGFFRLLYDGVVAGFIVVSLGAARDARYRWSYEQTGDVLTIAFEPPET